MVRAVWEEWEISQYVPVPCTITSAIAESGAAAKIETGAGVGRRTSTVTPYRPRVSYIYEVSGSRMQGGRYASRNYLMDTDLKDYRPQMAWLNEHRRTICFRSTTDPSESVLMNNRGHAGRYTVLILYLLMILIGGVNLGNEIQKYGPRGLMTVSGEVVGGLYRRAPPAWRWILKLTTAAMAAILALIIYVHGCS